MIRATDFTSRTRPANELKIKNELKILLITNFVMVVLITFQFLSLGMFAGSQKIHDLIQLNKHYQVDLSFCHGEPFKNSSPVAPGPR